MFTPILLLLSFRSRCLSSAMIRRLFSIAALTLITAIPALTQDDEIDAAMKKAMENANKPASKADMKKLEQAAKAQMDQAEAENKADEAKQKAKAQAVVDAKGPASLPDWTPQLPQFTPSGPPARKLVDGEPRVIVTGTSPLSPDALCDAWDKFANPKFSHERGGSDLNHNIDLFVNYRKNEDNTAVRLEAERKTGGKITRVTISSPLPVPSPAGQGD
jgi:hypothetical protein